MSANTARGAHMQGFLLRAWRLRGVRVAAWSLAILFVLRALIAVCTPYVLERVARARGLALSYRDLDLTLLGGALELHGLELREIARADDAASEPLLALDYAAIDVRVWKSIFEHPTVARAEIDGLRARVDVAPDGTVNWIAILGLDAPSVDADDETQERDKTPEPLDFALPAQVEALRLHGVVVHVTDRTVDPPLDARVAVDVRLDGTSRERHELELRATSRELFDLARVDARIDGRERALAAVVRADVAGLHLEPLRARLASLGIAPPGWISTRGREIDARCELRASAAPRAGSELDCTAEVELRDVALEADGELVAAVDRLALRTDSLSFESRSALAWSLAARAPGIAATLGLEGTCAVDGRAFDASVTVQAGGVAPARLERALGELGLVSELEHGTFTASARAKVELGADGRVAGGVEIADVSWADARALFTLDRAALEDVVFEPVAGLVRVGAIAITGSRTSARRDAAGSWHALGFATTDARAASEVPEGATPDAASASTHGAPTALASASSRAPANGVPAASSGASTTAAAAPALRIEIGRIAWRDNALVLVDETLAPVLELAISDVGAEIESLVVGSPAAEPVRLRAWVAVTDVVESLALQGTLKTGPGALDVEAALAVQGAGLRLTALAPQLASLGIEPTMANGSLAAEVSASVRGTPDGIGADLALERAVLREGDELLGALDLARVRGANLGAGGVRIASVAIGGGALAVERDASGGLRALGLRIALVAPSAPPALDSADAMARESAPSTAEAEPSPWKAALASLGPFALPSIAVEELSVTNVRALWRDLAASPPVVCTGEVRASVQSFSTRGDQPARFELEAAIPGSLARASVRGELALGAERASARATVEARGVRAGALAAYVPRGIALEVADGSFDLALDVELAPCAEGGRSARLRAGPLEWRDGERRLASFERAAITVTRADPEALVLDVGEVELAGAELVLERSTASTVRALGLAVDTALLGAAAALDTATAGGDAANTSGASTASAPSTATAGPSATRVGAPVRSNSERALPTVSLAALRLELARFELVDRSRGDVAEPIVARALLSTSEPFVLLAPDARALAPFRIALTAAAEPLVQALAIELAAAPYQDPIEVELAFAARGLNGAGCMALVPELASLLDASAMTAGELTARATVELDLERRRPTEFDLGRPFAARAALEAVHFKTEPEGEVQAGLEALRVEIARVDPKTGDVAIKTVDLDRPIGRVRRTSDGIEVAGIKLRLPGDAEDVAPRDESEVQDASAPLGEPLSASASIATPTAIATLEATDDRGADVSIGRLTVSGLDFGVRDESVTPPLALAFDAFDLEVRKLSTRDLRAGKSVQFAGALGAGKLPMRPRHTSDSLLEGVTGATADALAGKSDDASARESRPFFDELAFAGRIAVAPSLDGWVTVDLSALELGPLDGLARSFGMTIGDGVLDESLRVRFQGERGLSVDSHTVFTHLSLSEPADGPIENYLSLPVPLDTVLFLMKDFEGAHKVPVSFRLTDAGISAGEIARAGAGAAASVIATAVASSPLRLAGTFTDLLGLTGGEEPPPSASAASLGFDAGATVVRAGDRRALEKVRAELVDDDDKVVIVTHEFSAADLARAMQLSNPELDDCRQLSLSLRRKKAELDRQRGELAGTARTQFALGDRAAATRSIERVRALEAELGTTENGLDRLAELLKPGAERKREARARSAALAIASQRIVRVRQSLVDGGVAPERIEVRQVRVRPSKADGGGRIVLGVRERG